MICSSWSVIQLNRIFAVGILGHGGFVPDFAMVLRTPAARIVGTRRLLDVRIFDALERVACLPGSTETISEPMPKLTRRLDCFGVVRIFRKMIFALQVSSSIVCFCAILFP